MLILASVTVHQQSATDGSHGKNDEEKKGNEEKEGTKQLVGQ